MDSALYQRFFEVEADYWWSVWVRQMVRDWLPPGPPTRRLLDLGCGTGILSTDMAALSTVTSLDYVAEALHFCRRRDLTRVLRGDAHALPFADGVFDLLLAVDTLEHLRDDAAAMREVRRVMKPGATAIVNVPALRLLWSSHDVANHHFRRYRRAELRQVIEQAGFTIQKLSYTNLVLFPPTLVVRLAKRLFGGADTPDHEILELHPAVNSALVQIMAVERALVRRINLPIGTSLFAVAVAE